MAQKSTDLQSDALQGVADDLKLGAGWVLAALSYKYRTERPAEELDELAFPVGAGAKAYELMGRSSQGGSPLVARCALTAAPLFVPGVTRGGFSVVLAVAARSLGFEWDDDDEPMIPRLPVPGPRRSPEKGTVPCPRREQRTVRL